MNLTKLSEQEKLAWLRLIRSENIGPATFEALMRFYEKPSDVLNDLPHWLNKNNSKKTIKICSEKMALEEIENTEKLGARIIFSCEEDYPEQLRRIKSAPPVLTILGNKRLLQTDGVAFVGARNASLNGKNLTRRLAFDCVQANINVISGMALGIDGAAHEGALSAKSLNAGTIAVLGCGIDVVYPVENQDIYNQIKENGLLVSEFSLQTRPSASNFPRRNRLISGLSLATLVVEAKEKSGSLITAEFAKEQGRLVMAVPGSPLDDRSAVPNALLKSGAVFIESSKDILNAISDLNANKNDFSLCEQVEERTTYCLPDEEQIKSARQLIERELSANPVSEDELSRQLDMPVMIVGAVLLELELSGRLQRHANGRVSLVYDGTSHVLSENLDWMED
ncbi:MAG: DNA-protecting protein DprA [Alphaproteobacteria bacterium]|nr:DNA-protecting protein DprA [Alphaproteobacteria bacterium]